MISPSHARPGTCSAQLRAAIATILLSFAALLSHAETHAASLQISPIRIDLPERGGAAFVTLRNLGDVPLIAQVRVFRWNQRDGADQLVLDDEVVASPPMIEVAPRGEQLVRVLRPGTIPVEGEHAFRLFIDELPRVLDPATGKTQQGAAVRLQLRYSVPVFVGTPANGRPDVTFSLRRAASGWRLQARNGGEQHAQVGETALVRANDDTDILPISAGLFGYALAQSERGWDLSLPKGLIPGDHGGAALRIRTTINGTRQTLPLTVGP